MNKVMTEEEAVRQFASAMLGLLKAVRPVDSNASILAEIRRIATDAKGACEPEIATGPTQNPVQPLLLNSRQAAKVLSISTRTLFGLSVPRGPIPVVRIGTRTCYAVSDLETAIETLKVRPTTKA
jgi:hypothetical protein